jgi:hypothetical protein
MEKLDQKLKYKSSVVPWNPKSETELHYLMKKVVYHILKQKYKDIAVEVEKEIFETDENGQKISYCLRKQA